MLITVVVVVVILLVVGIAAGVIVTMKSTSTSNSTSSSVNSSTFKPIQIRRRREFLGKFDHAAGWKSRIGGQHSHGSKYRSTRI